MRGRTYSASHGCIRVPLNEGNPAKFFYEWVDTGTPESVARDRGGCAAPTRYNNRRTFLRPSAVTAAPLRAATMKST